MKRVALILLVFVLLAAWPLAALAEEAAPAGAGPVWVIELKDTVNPGSAGFLIQGLERARQADACAVVIILDTPGGVVESMRHMVQAMMSSPVPVVVYVAPSGARATSAGAFLVLAANVAAMAPATHLGAASPVAAGGKEIEGTMAKKAKSDLAALIISLAKKRGRDAKLAEKMVTDADSYDAVQAKELGLVDEIAPDLGNLLKQIQGKKVETAAGEREIDTRGKALHFDKPGIRDQLLSTLASPNLAYILMMIGLMGLYFELSHPGTIFPGVVGAVSLILAFFAMSALPVSYAGLALIGLAVVLFIAEIKVTSYGLLSIGGAVSLILGSMMMFETGDEMMAVSLSVLIPTLAGVIAFFGGVAFLAGRAQLRKSDTGQEGLVGKKAVAISPGKVKLMGEIWSVKSPRPLARGEEVKVLSNEGLLLHVEPVHQEGEGGSQ